MNSFNTCRSKKKIQIRNFHIEIVIFFIKIHKEFLILPHEILFFEKENPFSNFQIFKKIIITVEGAQGIMVE